MTPLPASFRKNGWSFDCLVREGDLAIYRHSKEPGIVDFEVVRIQRHDGFEIAGNSIAPAETYPPTTSWGTHGFTYPTEEAARAKFAALQAQELSAVQT